MIVTLDSTTPGDAELIAKLFAPPPPVVPQLSLDFTQVGSVNPRGDAEKAKVDTPVYQGADAAVEGMLAAMVSDQKCLRIGEVLGSTASTSDGLIFKVDGADRTPALPEIQTNGKTAGPTTDYLANAGAIPPPPPAAPAAGMLDASGLPWDNRIHSESKATVADGTWRKRRGVDPELVKTVEAELRGAPVAAATVPPPPPAVTLPAPPTDAVPPPPPAARVLGIADLSSAVQSGKVLMPDLVEQAKANGCTDVVALAGNPLALAAVLAHYEAQGVFK